MFGIGFGASQLTLCVALAAVIALPGRASAQINFADSAENLIIAGQQASEQHSPESLARSIQLFQLALTLLTGPEHLGRAGTVLNNIGSDHRDLGNTDSALVYFTRALDVRRQVQDRTGEANTLYNLGVVVYDQGRADTALVHFRAALAVQQELGDRLGEAAVLAAIGLAHQTLSRADSAGEYLFRALATARELGDGRLQARTLEFIGSLQRNLGRPDSADFYFSEALKIQRALGDRLGEVGTRVSQISLPAAEHRDAALVTLYQALDSVRAVSDRGREGIVLNLIGAAHSASGRADSALVYYAHALGVQRGMRDQRSEGVTLSHMAEVHAAQGRADSALAYYAWALPILRGAGDLREEGVALVNMGVVHHSSRTPAGMTRAVAYYDSADAVLAQVARSAGSDQARLSFAEVHASLFDSWALAWLARDEQVGARRAAYAALAAGERGRAQALRDLMRRRAGTQQAQPAGPSHTGPGKDLPAEGRDLVSQLRRSRVPAVSYMVTSNTLITFLVRGREVEAFTTNVSPDHLASLIYAVRQGLGSSGSARGGPDASAPGNQEDSDAWRDPAAQLAEILLPPRVREWLPASGELVVVPSGPLFLLPFSVLPLSGGSDVDSFLGLRYAIRYAPSLQALASLEGETHETRLLEQVLVVGNPTMPWVRDTTGFQPSSLPHAENEAKWVAGHVSAGALLGGAATEGAVRERMGTATLVHLATHGHAYATADSARESYVVLAKGPDDDGLLTVGEVLDAVPPMRAELVVLSACETGLGDLTQAEGTVGMQRAFLARGARGVLVSLWSVRDESTSILMQRFYEHWLEDTTRGERHRAEALRLAQRQLFSDGFAHPRYWAAFQLVGAR